MSRCDSFRLAAPSECSLQSKARIDALFEDSRSVCSSSWCTSTSLVPRNVGCCTAADEEQQRRVNSAVQARIEAMFASVEAESSTPGECAAAVLPVKYMGAATVGGRVASVRGLQEPLRQLVERIGDSVNAELEVSRRGLTYRTSEVHEKNNPFRRIAVWSALKLQTRRRPNSNNSEDLLYAFVPLVADEIPMINNEDRHTDLYRTMRGLAKNAEDYPPIFAVVMRRPGAARLLECHAFACRCDEDAIAAAATLYRALLADLEATARRPRQNNGLGCVSLASVVSSTRETSPARSRRCSVFRENRAGHVLIEKVPPPPPPPPSLGRPVRPPRSKKSSVSSVNTEDELSSSTVTPINVSDVIEKNGRPRKKKNSDIKAEDVLEARHRRLSLSKDFNINESKALANSSGSLSANETSQERRMNAKNKIYGSRSLNSQVLLGGTQVIEKMNKENKFYNEKLPSSDRTRSGFYDFEFSNENSLYESTRIYAKTCIAEMKLSDQRIYEAARPSNSSTASSSTLRRDSYAARPPPSPYHIENISNYAGQRRRSINSTGHCDHFRDVDKIYSLNSEEIYDEMNTNKHGIKRMENRLIDHKRASRQTPASMRSSISEHSSCSSKRLNRVSTMDRPIRKSGNETRKHATSTTPHQHKLQQHQQERRRSRAGSEPPTSRIEATAAQTSAMLKRSQSDVDVDKGDLLTRVELPRRGSFLKPESLRKRDGIEGGNSSTPLGFTELFDEFRNQEGLTSVDDILAAIIDPEGMSFNDLKPLYKEFLLKLAATLTQDELYQRSASIMRRRRRPQRRRSSRASNRPARLLRRAIKRSVSRLKSSSTAPTEFTSVIYPARKLNDRGSYGSSSSCNVTKGGHRHKGSKVLASKLVRRSTTRCSSSKSRIGQTTSEDSDTCRRANRSLLAANRSSSGYVSCSECSYDSESCTCISADKCYCSLSRSSKTPQDAQPIPPPPMTMCSCDTDSCSESNKCYCARRPKIHQQQHKQPSILEQLRQKGIVPSDGTLSRGVSPDRSKTSRTISKCLASSKSLEYLRIRSSSVRGSADNLALDYDLFRPGGNSRRRSSQCSSGSEKVLVVSARDPQGRLIYVGGTESGDVKDSSRRGQSKKKRNHGNAVPGHHEALSIKKSAEIAAVFGGQHRLGRRTSSASSLKSSISLEAGLGYLP
ncbi:uncharacterized protein LOC131672626 [Phymastichus coffea]|uniref:uncharacterized protein LOC131672626 n=1 Tax=Phymastichus coffea TaxID=108790 RepID=UPI00273B76E4|nr:uncharacterized protein LOC131672626 [Phymastichus coffea]